MDVVQFEYCTLTFTDDGKYYMNTSNGKYNGVNVSFEIGEAEEISLRELDEVINYELDRVN